MGDQRGYFEGVLTIEASGPLLEPFLQACTRRGCRITGLRRLDETTVRFSVRLKDWKTLRSLRRKYKCRLTIKEGKGVPFLYKLMMRRLSVAAAFLAALVLIFLAANTLWSIKVEGLTPELEAAVEKKLTSYGVSPGRLTIGMKDPNDIQQKLLEDIPDLLWIGVKKQGTSYHLYGVKKIRHDTNQDTRPSDLIASKKGMIVQTFIKKGRPLVSVYDVVKKGQVLATGELVEEGEVFVHTEGHVTAETWYRVEQELPLQQILTLTDGTVEAEYHLKIGSWSIPLWGWWRGNEGSYRDENVTTDWKVFSYPLPLNMKRVDHFAIDTGAMESSRKEIEKIGRKAAGQSLLQELEPGAEIKDEKVLHLSEEHGKVKLILLYKVYEDIAETKYISQGD
ncbi:sporulation protein YqfD [Halobacillus litoralis]|uniref:Sporulation protein YqfD n=1 Tax=Halobacillus litoralis TaxID=45668 RepID=A0A845DTG2_9BACI|nr:MULTISPECIES: sporulation protein YqfD [Halobacillus]MYL19815.1 sporulation protein YqfD [Halobacillus litoralis]MYL28961.1 sporulation protein YqfD [Halobacillus halophilus]